MSNLGFMLPVDLNQQPVPWKNLRTILDYNASNNLQYIGMAPVGSLSASAVWQIQEVKYEVVNSTDVISSISYAAQTAAFNQIFDNRTTLSYL
jgi:hypothetical protein